MRKNANLTLVRFLKRLLVLIDEYELFTAVHFFSITRVALSFKTHCVLQTRIQYHKQTLVSLYLLQFFRIKIEKSPYCL